MCAGAASTQRPSPRSVTCSGVRLHHDAVAADRARRRRLGDEEEPRAAPRPGLRRQRVELVGVEVARGAVERGDRRCSRRAASASATRAAAAARKAEARRHGGMPIS